MKMTLIIMSCCTVSITIPDLWTVKREILLCSRWVNIPTLTYKMQLASILYITCSIHHLAQQQSQRKLQWSRLRKWPFRRVRWADTAPRHSVQPNVGIKRMKARAAWRQTESEPLGHCAAGDPKRSLRQGNDEKCTSEAMKRKRNGLRIMLREKLLWQESKLKTQMQRSSKCRTIWRMLK